jgi:hypothetical protein
MVRRNIGFIEVLAPAAPWWIAAAATVAAALEAREATTAARKAATSASNDAPHYRGDDQPANDYNCDDRPPRKCSVSITNSAVREEKQHTCNS